MGFFGVVAGVAHMLAFLLVVAAVGFGYLAHRRSRATLFADLVLTASLLMLALLYLAYVEGASGSFPGDGEMYTAGAALGYALVAGFLLGLAVSLWRYTRRTEGAVLVSPDFLIGLRTRTKAMYGDGPSRFIVYAVGKESAEKSARRFLADAGLSAAQVWRDLPRWSRSLGYGRMRVVSAKPGEEVRLEVTDTIESLQGDGRGGACDMTRGYLAGLGSALHAGSDCECVETRCGHASGAPCEFTLHWFPRAKPPPATDAPAFRREA